MKIQGFQEKTQIKCISLTNYAWSTNFRLLNILNIVLMINLYLDPKFVLLTKRSIILHLWDKFQSEIHNFCPSLRQIFISCFKPWKLLSEILLIYYRGFKNILGLKNPILCCQKIEFIAFLLKWFVWAFERHRWTYFHNLSQWWCC